MTDTRDLLTTFDLGALGTFGQDKAGAFDDVLTLDVNDAAVPYDLAALWSDGARKTRRLFLPNDGNHDQPDEQIAFSEDGNWTFPTDMVLIKQFELPLDENDPSITTQLETRLLALGPRSGPAATPASLPR